MPPRSRRRNAQANPQPPVDDPAFDDMEGTVDLSTWKGGSDEDFDFEADAANDVDFEAGDEDVDFEGLASSTDDDVDFEALSDGLDYAEDDEDFEAEEAAPASRSGRGRGSARASARGAAGSRRSARQNASKSDRKSKKLTVKKELTEEELAARRKAIKGGLLLTLMMILLIGAGIGFYFLFMRVNPERSEAVAHLRQARQQLRSLSLLLNAEDADGAEELVDRVLSEHLVLPMFASAGSPDPDPESVISVGLARDAYDLRLEFERQRPEIAIIRENIRAKANFDHLMRRLSNLGGEEDLNALRASADAFMDNPAYPTRGPDMVIANRYRNQYIHPVRNLLVDIERERARRISAGTTDVVAAANQETAILMRDRRYGQALSLIDELARRHPDANLRSVRETVLESARRAWESDRNRARNEFQIASDPGSASGDRQAALERAREILHLVVTRYGEGVAGVGQFVEEARRMQREFGF